MRQFGALDKIFKYRGSERSGYCIPPGAGEQSGELNAPIDQLARFREQAALQARGDDEAHWLDEDYVRALEYGMPPAAGEGIGIDRLLMMFANQPTIRETILFPLLRPEGGR